MKKNLFIFWDERLNPTAGGIHRCIINLLTYLPSRGYNVYYLYTQDNYTTFIYNSPGGESTIFNITELRQFLIEEHCNVILGQEGFFSPTFTRVVKNLDLPGVKFINQYHSTLKYFDKKLVPYYLGLEFRTNRSLKSRIGLIARWLFYPIWKHHVNSVQNNIYRYNYLNSDCSLLLSTNEVAIFNKIVGAGDLDRCTVIPNPLSWDEISSPDILNKKRKEILIVSRIYNSEKRIDLALKAWLILQKQNLTHDWTLRIVGDGIHKRYLMELCSKWNLRNVVWEGRQDPKRFYETAGIFLMTSAVEGWGLTLTESMQSGVVPIAFDSYSAVRDIITDGYDGLLVKWHDVKEFAAKMAMLMTDSDLRTKMALNGLDSCRRFRCEAIMDQWKQLLDKLTAQE